MHDDDARELIEELDALKAQLAEAEAKYAALQRALAMEGDPKTITPETGAQFMRDVCEQLESSANRVIEAEARADAAYTEGRQDGEDSLRAELEEAQRTIERLCGALVEAQATADAARRALEAVEQWMSSETGPLFNLWENGDIGDYDDSPTDWEQTLFDVRDWRNGCVPTASLGYGTEWPAVTLYREILTALATPDCQRQAALGKKDGEVWDWCGDCGMAFPLSALKSVCNSCERQAALEGTEAGETGEA